MSTSETQDQASLWQATLKHAHYIPKILSFGIIASAITTASTFLITPKFTSVAQLMPPQQSQSGAAALLGSLGSLAGAAAGAAGTVVGQTPSDQLIGLMRSRTVADNIIQKFNLRARYDTDFQFEARDELKSRTRIEAGKDSLIDLSVEDEDVNVARDIVNEYVEQIRLLSKTIAIGEAAQRRLFFENQLTQTKEQLERTQTELAATGVDEKALKASPDLAIGTIAQLQAQISAQEIKLKILRQTLTEAAPEVQSTKTELAAINSLLLKATSQSTPGSNTTDSYITKFRNFKYYETLYELIARQYELAKSDEARDSTLIQIVDSATVAEKKSSPKRAKYAIGSLLIAIMIGICYAALRETLASAMHTIPSTNGLKFLKRIMLL